MRNPSARPELVVDAARASVGDTARPPGRLGIPGPFGRERVVFALPMATVELARPKLLRDVGGVMLADPSGVAIGWERVIVHRMVWAGKAEDTRRL